MPEGRFVIEQAPAWGEGSRRGVVAEGAVGARPLGRFRLFRYEIRCWRDGVIPDIAEAVESPHHLSSDTDCARRLLELAAEVPTPVWGRDELRAGEMWNSNSVVAWLLARSGVDVMSVPLPRGGRAPGWQAGIVVAHRWPQGALTSRSADPHPESFGMTGRPATVEGTTTTYLRTRRGWARRIGSGCGSVSPPLP